MNSPLQKNGEKICVNAGLGECPPDVTVDPIAIPVIYRFKEEVCPNHYTSCCPISSRRTRVAVPDVRKRAIRLEVAATRAGSSGRVKTI